MSKTCFLVWLTILVSGCTAHYGVLTENEDFIIVNAKSSDTYESLALKYLGSENSVDVIKRVNNFEPISTRTPVAIPKNNLYPTNVFAEGYHGIPILCYHQFSSETNSRSATVLPIEDFKQQMHYLAKNNYTVISLEQLIDFLDGNIVLPQKSVVITIDDGYRSFYELAYPIIKAYQFPSTLFVYPQFVGGGLSVSWDELREMKQDPLVKIESHSFTHNNLARNIKKETQAEYVARLESEIQLSHQAFENRMSFTPTVFAYPYGDTSNELIDLLKQNSYTLALTVDRGSNQSYANPYLLRRNMILAGRSMKQFKKSLNTFRSINTTQ